MSEEILKALMQLFALIVKQDEGVEVNEKEYVRNFLALQLSEEQTNEYYSLFEKFAGIGEDEPESEKKQKLTSVKDSVRILGICKKINKTLTQNQKVIVLVRLFEIVGSERKFSDQRMAIINTVAEVFNVTTEEFKSIESFVVNNEIKMLDDPNVLLITDSPVECQTCKQIRTEKLDTHIAILRIQSVDLYFLKYTGAETLFLNGLAIHNRRIYLYSPGSTVKLPKGKPVYYSDVAAHFLADLNASKISFTVNNLEFRFPNGNIGLIDVSISEQHGKLVGIMGASGAGKTTLLNVLCGNEKPSKGEVLINGYNLHTQKKELEGVIGLIPQDDLLIEELTVFENLYYSAKLCFKEKSEQELTDLVHKTLHNLGLFDRKDLKVGSPLNKFISGGQRKRLNIALELIREPSILFVDEPTSGLSSRDSENVMDLLRELALKGKLIFVVIHQPSSEIYKMFDKMVILDTGGYQVYYGNPVEAVMYFKRMDHQINAEIGECPSCGNVNPELIFNIVEARVVDEYGNYTNTRKVAPYKWEEHYKNQFTIDKVEEIKESPPKTLSIPSRFKQLAIYTIRDFLSKISNTQYIALNLLEAPLLGFILSFIIRYIADPNSDLYIFRENENISIYIFMSLIVSLFLGLTVSAEEIFRDRKILKREAFLNLSRSSYLISKVLILFTLSAIQAATFVIIGNTILGIKGMYFTYWFALFSTASFANMLGLNVSASFNSAVTIYIVIPLLMIPMMVLSGAMFSFDKLNRTVGSVDKVPVIAEVMVTKWSYEALMVHTFKDNEFHKKFYDLEKRISIADFKQVHYVPELMKRLDNIENEINQKGKIEKTIDDLILLGNEAKLQHTYVNDVQFKYLDYLNPQKFEPSILPYLRTYLDELLQYYVEEFNKANLEKNNTINWLVTNNGALFQKMKQDYTNEHLEDQLKKVFEKNKILEYNHFLVQQVDPIYLDPRVNSIFSIRSHFYAPRKHLLGKYFDTFWFNMSVIWIFTLTLYITLYYELLKKLLNLPETIRMRKKNIRN